MNVSSFLWCISAEKSDERLNKVEQLEKSFNAAQQDRTNQKATFIRIFTVVLQNFKQSSNGMIVKNYSQLTR